MFPPMLPPGITQQLYEERVRRLTAAYAAPFRLPERVARAARALGGTVAAAGAARRAPAAVRRRIWTGTLRNEWEA